MKNILQLNEDVNINKELIEISQWILWKKGEKYKKNRFKKIPIDLNGKNIDVTKIKGFPFNDVLEAYKNGVGDGIGFILTPNDSYYCLDVDDLNEMNNKTLPFHDTYYHISPSGKGFHYIFKLPNNINKQTFKGSYKFNNHYELLLYNRFITIEPNVTWKNLIIEVNPYSILTILDFFHDKIKRYIFRNQLEALEEYLKNEGKTLQDIGINDTSPSGWDYQLAWRVYDSLSNILKKFPNKNIDEHEIVKEVMYLSELKRDKWEKSRGNTTYIDYTIERAIEKYDNKTKSKSINFKNATWEEVKVDENQDVKMIIIEDMLNELEHEWKIKSSNNEFLIPNFIEYKSVTLTYGGAKSGKSYIWLYISVCLACGQNITEEIKVNKPFKVLFLEAETPYREIEKRMKKILYKIKNEKLKFFKENFKIFHKYETELKDYNIDNNYKDFFKFLENELKSKHYDLIVISSFTGWFEVDMNEQREITPIFKEFRKIASNYNCHIHIIHHANWQGRITGSKTFERFSDMIFNIKMKNKNHYLNLNYKGYWKIPYPNIIFWFDEEGYINVSHVGKNKSKSNNKNEKYEYKEILKHVPTEWTSKKEVKEILKKELNKKETTVRNILRDLKKKGYIEERGKTRDKEIRRLVL